VSVTTAQRWVNRYRLHGRDAMTDRSSRPKHSPGRLGRRSERRILGLRVWRRWGPARIGFRLRLNPSTVHKVLDRYGAPPLAWTDPGTGARLRATPKPLRYEHPAPGELVHMDVRKLGRIPDGGGTGCTAGPGAGGSRRRAANPERRSSTTPWTTTPG
jgi:hypothetical protein